MRGRGGARGASAAPVLALVGAAAVCFALAGPVTAQDDGLAPDLPQIQTPESTNGAGGLPMQTIETTENIGTIAIAPVLTVDQDLLFVASAWGRRAQAELEAEGGLIVAENDRLADQLAAEEAALTRQRPDLAPADFRRLAEAFDTRATEIRRQRAQLVQELNAWAETDRSAFYRAALPVMGELMQDRGAVAVLDRRTVFVSLDAIDITEDLIALLDESLGDGAGVVPQPSQEPGPDPAGEGDETPAPEPDPEAQPAGEGD